MLPVPARAARLVPTLALLLVVLIAGCDSSLQLGDAENEPDGPLADALERRGTWTWAAVEGATCRDGSATGFGARLREESSRLVIYLEGGGACFNDPTCRSNPDSYGRATFNALRSSTTFDDGIFDTTRSENPLADWHAAYVPYCTGDVHAGSAPDTRVAGVDRDGDGQDDLQQFVGHDNVERYVATLADHFGSDLDHVLLTGSSAGGFGTLVNYGTVREAFPDARVTLLDDSGPPVFDDEILTPSLEAHWINLWNITGALSSPVAAAVEADGLAAIYQEHTNRYPNQTFGLLSYWQDATIRDFYGYRQPGCEDPERCVFGSEFARALEDVRAQAPAWGTYFAEGFDHTFLRAPRFYDTSADGTPLPVWTQAILDGQAPDVAATSR